MRLESPSPGRQRGAVIVLVAVIGAVLIGFLGMVIDLGRLFVSKTELQNAMDACALAAAGELRPGVSPPDPQAINRAVSAGMTTGNRNRVGFQAVAAGITPGDIWFSDHLSNNSGSFPYGYLPSGSADPATARYAMCARTQGGIPTWFMQVLRGFLGMPPAASSVGALATATRSPSQTSCAIPLGLCRPAGGTAPGFGLVPGQWYGTKFAPGDPPEGVAPTGNFNWIDFFPGKPTPGCPGGGAKELDCILEGGGECNLPPVGPAMCPNGNNPPAGCVGQTGAAESLAHAYSTRFGLYHGGSVSLSDLAHASPDYTGRLYNPATWTAEQDAYGGSSPGGVNFHDARIAHLPYQGSISPDYSSASGSQLAEYGADRRVVIVPIVECPVYEKGQNVPVLGYACVLMLNPFFSTGDDVRVEYLGPANDPNSPCATSGLAGGVAGPLVPVLVH